MKLKKLVLSKDQVVPLEYFKAPLHYTSIPINYFQNLDASFREQEIEPDPARYHLYVSYAW
jgi:hypothetical protein